MKRRMTMVLVFALAIGLMGCGGSDTATTEAAKTEAKETEAAETQAVGAAETEVAEEVATEAQTEAPEETFAAVEYTMPETVIVDNDQCCFTVTGIKQDGLWGYTVTAEVENKTDRTLMFSWNSTVVDGWMIDPFWATEIAGGKKSKESITFYTGLEEAGIENPTQISFDLWIYDSEDWMTSYVEDTFTIYPQGEDAATVVLREDQSTDEVLAETDDYKIVLVNRESDEDWGYSLNVYLENKTDKEVMFSVDNASINGYMCDPFWATNVKPGCRALSEINWYPTTLEESGVETVEEIELPMAIYDYETYNEVGSETFQIKG